MNKRAEGLLSSLVKQVIDDPRNNRAPSQIELNTLLGIRSQNEQLSTNIKSQLAIATEAQDQIQERHDRILRDYESVQAELKASQIHVGLLKAQESMLHAQHASISKLVHPLRRYPVEILRMIFEWVVDTSVPQWLVPALRISHVCRAWRSIATGTASLWSYVNVSMDEEQNAVWNRLGIMKDHLRSSPLEIVIRELNEDNFSLLVPYIPDLALAGVKALHLSLEKPFALQDVKNPRFVSSRCHVESLILSAAVTVASDEDDVFNYQVPLIWLPNLKNLQVKQLGCVGMGGTRAHNALRSLTLDEISTSTLPSQLGRLPNLEVLRISYSTLELGAGANAFVISKLQRLSVTETTGFPWDKCTAPQLRELETDVGSEEVDYEVAVNFICRHPSLRNLEACLSEASLVQISASIPDLESLDVADSGVDWILGQAQISPVQPFPKLTTLKTWFTSEQCLHLEVFESFVLKRCRVSDTAKTLETEQRELTSWKIMDDRKAIKGAGWRSSALMKHFFWFDAKDPFYSVMLYLKPSVN